MRNTSTDYIGLIRRLFRVNGDEIVYRSVGSNHNCFNCDCGMICRFHARATPAFDLFGVTVGVNPAAFSLDCFSQAGQIFQGMKLCLSWKSQCWSGVERIPGHAVYFFNIDKSSAVCCFKFVVKDLFGVAWRHEEITIEPLEFALDSFFFADRFHLIDRGGVTLRSQPRTFLAM